MTDKNPGGRERRRYFRLEYPPDERPELKIGKKTFQVLDVSERGVRFINDKDARFAEWIKGTITFHDGVSMEIEGKIVWECGDELGLQIVVMPIPPARVLQEQRYLIAKEKLK